MARPMKRRRVCQLPATCSFSPEGNTGGEENIELAVEEYEVIRLIDYLGFTQSDCALQMNVARTTVQAVYDSARKKISDALVNGRRLVIRGGSYVLCPNSQKCCGKDCRDRLCEGPRCDRGDYRCSGCPCGRDCGENYGENTEGP